MTTIVFLLTPRIHLLDLAGPVQTFSTAAEMGLDYEIRYVSERVDVLTAQGLPLRAETGWPELTAKDVVMVPGHHVGSRPLHRVLTPGQAGALAAHHTRGGTVASVCSGAFALGEAGLLDGRRCTTHHALQQRLARMWPRARVVTDVLYVDDGTVMTSAGIASGIDLALYQIATWHGPAVAASIAREMVVYVRRNGDDPQVSAMLRHRAHVADIVHRAQDMIDRGYASSLPLSDLASAAGISERTLSRTFVTTIGMTPLRYQQQLRLERAQYLLANGATMEGAARAVGFQDARMLRRLRSRAGSG